MWKNYKKRDDKFLFLELGKLEVYVGHLLVYTVRQFSSSAGQRSPTARWPFRELRPFEFKPRIPETTFTS